MNARELMDELWAKRHIEAIRIPVKSRAMTKRGYSRDFTPKTDRRIKIDIDRVPPTLADALRAKVKRKGLSVRSVTLNLWKEWVANAD